MDIQQINGRIDGALLLNRRAENIVMGMSVAIFLSGLATLFFAYWQENPYLAGGGVVLVGLLYWPIRELLKLRRDNLLLQVLPVMLTGLPDKDAAQEIMSFTAHLRGKK